MLINKSKSKIIFGLFTLYFVAMICSCTKSKDDPIPVPPAVPYTPPPVSAALRLLALGDSYTIGQSVPVGDRFPHQAVARLKQLNRQFAEPDYIAHTGWTTANLIAAIQTGNRPANYDIVTLLIGVNNQFQRRDTAEYKQQFTQCLQQAIFYAGNRKERVIVLSIPDYGATPFGQSLDPARIATEIDAYNAINLAISNQAGAHYIEITKGSRDAISDKSLVASDSLHPSGKEYLKWAEKLTSKILTVLR